MKTIITGSKKLLGNTYLVMTSDGRLLGKGKAVLAQESVGWRQRVEIVASTGDILATAEGRGEFSTDLTDEILAPVTLIEDFGIAIVPVNHNA